MKRHGFEIDDYNLPASVRKRIDDLVDLNINPSTINLITAEFSASSDDVKENIGRYIARLLEIEDFVIQQSHDRSQQIGAGLNLKHQMGAKNRQTNLLRIQQIFLKNDQENERVNKTKQRAQEINASSEPLLDFKQAMVINNDEELSETVKLQQLANKRRKIELAIIEEQEKIKVAQRQYKKAKLEDDDITQELKLNVVKFANKRLKEISEAIQTYKTVDKIPDEIIDNKSNKKDFLNENDKTNFEKLQNDIKNLNEKKSKTGSTQTLEIDLETFFDVPGFGPEDSYEAIEYPKYSKNVEKASKKVQDSKKIKTKNVKEKSQKDVKKNSQSELGENKIASKNSEAEKIIKKIKKKSKAKDRQIEKINKEKEDIKKELTKLKQEKKIQELRELENKKKKLNENFEENVKKEKRKIETTYQILEKKWKAGTVSQSLNSKQKAFNAVKTIKEKSEKIESKNDKNIKIEQPKVIEKSKSVEQPKLIKEVKVTKESNQEKIKVTEKPKVIEKPKQVEQPKKVEESKFVEQTKQEKISFLNKGTISAEVRKQNIFEEDEKRISYLERKKALNIITFEELNELEVKKKRNNHVSSKVDLRKFKLIKKY
ncbi:hypothetical protein [Spiroplasma monobiae]|uniref:Uncharacterized protein n=1 Tax=Spiroplasma monobiae MQ-1 TaxID=1336748 RepID=A0A2K9LUA6_SPISQ|nr:hypothetical protein [Spiroplasma monobiae]AUM62637.1 hypothetical protein SMONO_v1c03880 [Spiroplasma monobiae MQ-1]